MTPREIIRRVRRLEIRTRRIVDESLAGSYHSVFRGRGMEFAEVREYTSGDDVRTVDWNVSARMGHLYVKKFTEERELTVVLLADVSGSERFGTGETTKMRVSAEIGALLVFSAIRNKDRAGLLLFTDQVEQFVPPRKGREHGLRVLRELLTVEPRGQGTRIASALEYMQRVLTKRAVVFLVSDFQDRGYERALRVAAQKHDIVAIRVSDPREEVLPPVGLISVLDPETGDRGLLDASNAQVRAAYREHAENERRRVRETLRRTGVDLLELSTHEDYERPLVRFFRERAPQGRAGRGLTAVARRIAPRCSNRRRFAGWSALLIGVGCATTAVGAQEQASPSAHPLPSPGPRIELRVEPREITVGDPLQLSVEVRLPPETRLETRALGQDLGPFSIIAGNWEGPTDDNGEVLWRWLGQLTAFRTGDFELPAITLRLETGGEETTVTTEVVPVTVRSVLAPEEGEAPEPADLKPPVVVPPDWTALRSAIGLVLLLGALSLAAWWLQRRYAARLAAVEAPEDPFHRTPPHVWVYGELQRLLERRLAEQGQVDEFYAELSRILKRYLSGRYRLELMEQTTAEVPGNLEQAGASREAIVDATTTLRTCDRVKFARERPGPEQWKTAVEDVYRIVDRTKPIEDAERPASRGVA